MVLSKHNVSIFVPFLERMVYLSHWLQSSDVIFTRLCSAAEKGVLHLDHRDSFCVERILLNSKWAIVCFNIEGYKIIAHRMDNRKWMIHRLIKLYESQMWRRRSTTNITFVKINMGESCHVLSSIIQKLDFHMSRQSLSITL